MARQAGCSDLEFRVRLGLFEVQVELEPQSNRQWLQFQSEHWPSDSLSGRGRN